MRWREEIDELHQFFEGYFLGTESSLDRVDAVLSPTFTIVGPHGVESDRPETMQALADGHAHTASLRIATSDHRLLLAEGNVVVASYIEHHQLRDRSNHRRSTVVFTIDEDAPNGLRWEHVHETWVEDPAAASD